MKGSVRERLVLWIESMVFQYSRIKRLLKRINKLRINKKNCLNKMLKTRVFLCSGVVRE